MKLTPREGKVLRFVVSHDYEPVRPSMCVNDIAWSDLPKTAFMARGVLERLRVRGLVERSAKGYTPTKDGRTRIRQADKAGEWREPPRLQAENAD